MKTFEDFNINPIDKLFIELSHIDELEIKFDFIYSPKQLYYFYKDKLFFMHIKKPTNFMYVSLHQIWNPLIKYKNEISKNVPTEKMIRFVVDDLVEKYFNLKNITTDWIDSQIKTIEYIFNI